MEPLRDVLQNSCSTPLLKKELNYTYEKLHCGIFYNRSRTTALCLNSEFQTVEVISQGSWAPEVSGGPRVQRSWVSRGSMGSWGTGGPGVPRLDPTFLPCLKFIESNYFDNVCRKILHIFVWSNQFDQIFKK